MVGERGQKLVIVNLQSTPMDHLCALRIFAKTDQVSQEKRERERVRGAAGVAGEQSADEEVGSGDPSVPATENSHHISYLHPLGPCGGRGVAGGCGLLHFFILRWAWQEPMIWATPSRL